MSDLSEELREARLHSYARVRGGFPIPLAGALYWGGLGVAGLYLTPHDWGLAAFVTSGLIFPVAVVLAKLFRNGFLSNKTPVDGAMVPAFIGMLLFWPAAITAYLQNSDLVPLILAIGMSAHWPVIGWMYGRSALFSSHAIVRAVAVTGIWHMLPDQRYTMLPWAVAAIYVVTVIAIFLDSSAVRRRIGMD